MISRFSAKETRKTSLSSFRRPLGAFGRPRGMAGMLYERKSYVKSF
jgi:hypothetical protein